jgi:cytochrome c oxidase assembly protein subunit 15
MTSFLRSDRSRPVAVWLLVVAALVLAMVAVGGATRLTGSGLSITEWRPVTGAIPPLNAADWASEFAKYREIPQYQLLNRGMSLAEFKAIYWWEWIHRFLGRLVGVVFLVPFAIFLARRQIPRRLVPRCILLFVLGGLQGAIGWWMVASGLADRVHVAPERLTVHLGLAFALFAALIWTALDAWTGAARQTLPSPWGRAAALLLLLVFFQILLGALVAGNHAGYVFNDWPLMNGRLVPDDYPGDGVWATIAHTQGPVQLHHRLGGYLLFVVALATAWRAMRTAYLSAAAKQLALAVAAAVVLQAVLGVVTLLAAAPLGLALAHQLMAALVLALAVGFAWRVRRV